ncbi:MAG: hypothetical protein ACAI44_05050, partial [Candidatus Sericytochromatia bacterium]
DFFLQAEGHFAAALELDGANLFTRDEYARVCFNLADLEKGAKAQAWWRKTLDAFERVLATDPKPGLAEAALRESAVFWAYARAKCGQFAQAREQLWLMSTYAPQDWFPRYILAAVHLLEYRQQGQPGQLAAATEAFRRSLALNPVQARETGSQDPDLELLRQQQPELFTTDSEPPSANKELES